MFRRTSGVIEAGAAGREYAMTLCSFAKSWLKYYRDNAELKKQHPPEELGRDFQEGSGWKCLPGRGVMEGGRNYK
mgnify:CR=1 FL=1